MTIPDSQEITLDLLKRRRVFCLSGDGTDLVTWPVYKCINCETTLDDKTYLLSGGAWYEIEHDFLSHVDGAFKKVPTIDLGISQYSEQDLASGKFSEGKFIERICSEHPDDFLLMDKKTIQHGGGQSKIEFCDIYTCNKNIIHIKRYGGSSSLSHLFLQGIVSGELFRSDSSFRTKVNGKLDPKFTQHDPSKPPGPDEYRIVFAVISQSQKELWLPFFSRLNLTNAERKLRGWGYDVGIARIGVDQVVAKKKKF